MAEITLTAKPRPETGTRPSRRLRREGLVPAEVYGLDQGNEHVAVSERELHHILSGEAGLNVLIDLHVDGRSQLTMARQIQRDLIRGTLLHVDFVRVDVHTAVTAEVPVTLVGEAEGVKNGGMLDQALFTVTVEAKPTDIPNSIDVDVSDLDIGDQVRVESLPAPEGVTVITDPDELVVVVAAPTVEAAEEAPEGIEGEIFAEGEAPPEGEAGAEAAAEAKSGEGESD